jgi:hypothetical protein
VTLIAVVGGLGLLAAAFTYIDDGGKGTGGIAGKGSAGAGPSSRRATVTGSAQSVEVSGSVRLDSLSIDVGTRSWSVLAGDDTIDGTGPVSIQADGIAIDLSRSSVGVDQAHFSSRNDQVSLPDHATINGQAVQGQLLRLSIGPGDDVVRWLDPPASMRVDNVNEFSWAGSGEIGVDDQHLSGAHVGAMGSFALTLTRGSGAIELSGTGDAQQVFIDGQPALRTTAAIERLRTDITVHAGDANDSTYVTWAPRDTGRFAVCILRIAPRSGHAEWVNVGLQHMPPMFGGLLHEPVGGDTSGLGDHGRFFGGPDAIDSFIGAGDADRRDLSVSVPIGTPPGVYPIEIAIEGNFEPVSFSMTITVAA